MPKPTPFERWKAWTRRVFFWLPSSGNEEVVHDHGHDHALVAAVVSQEKVSRLKQLRYASRVFSFNERRLVVLCSLVGILSLGIAGAMLLRSRTVSVPAVGGTFTEALIGQPKYLNPVDAIANDVDRDLVSLVYSGLFRYEGMDAVPDLVEQYRWSDDGKTLTLKLRADARFHDNVPLVADDVQFTFESIVDPARKSPLAPLYRGLKITAEDEHTVSFQLPKPDATFLTKLTVGILPAHAWQDVNPSTARLSILNVKPIGSGPYKVKSLLKDSQGNVHSYTLERWDQYYGIKPYIKSLVFEFFADKTQALDALKSDLIDGVAFVSATEAERYASSGRKQDVKLDLPESTIAFFNLKDKLLSDATVRQALALAVDRNDLRSALGENADVIMGAFPFDASTTSSAMDLEKARQLLTDAGWVLPQNGNVRIFQKKAAPPAPAKAGSKTTTPTAAATSTTPIANASSTELALTIDLPDDSDLINVGQALQRQWSLLGAKVELNVLPTDVLMREATRERTAQIVLLNILLSPDQNLFPFWWSGQTADRGMNFSNLSDRTVDDALEKTRTATTTVGLEQARKELSKAILNTNAALFLLRPTQHYLLSSKVNGTDGRTVISEPAQRFQNLEHWYLKQGLRWK